MNQVDTIRVTFPLKKNFVVSKGGTASKTNLLTIMNNRYNGEASSSVHYGPSIEDLERDLLRGAELLGTVNRIDIHTLYEINRFDIHPIARSALVGMVLNFISGETRKYPWEVLSLSTPVGIKNSMTISLSEPGEMEAAIRDADFPILKIKLGGPDDKALLPILEKIKGKEVRIDANGGWSCEQAEEMIFYLAKIGIKIIEQPTTTDRIKDWPVLKGQTEGVELIVDEGLETVKDYQELKEHVDGINIKMEKSGGILEGIRLADEAHKDGKKVMLGCMVESSVGIAQSVYMSSMADYHDLDAPQLLENDIARGINYKGDTIEVDREIIGGPKLRRNILEKYSAQ